MLGAACGELVAGRRLGNRAMIWGAVAGTLPDFDITAGFVADPVTSLAFHRCVTHSLYYALLASPLLAWIARALYGPDGRPLPGYLYRVWLPATLALYLILALGSWASPTPLHGIWAYSGLVALVSTGYALAVWGFRQLRQRPYGASVASYRDWWLLFLVGIGTHPLLDCFTTYGTQVFQPFDDLRVAWNTVSVVDPAYTLPFLILLLVASRALRQNPLRRRLVWTGVAISTAYLAFTVYNLQRIRTQVAQDLQEAGISYQRFIATPTLMQNVLWNVAIDQGDSMRVGQIGLLDEPFQLTAEHLVALPKQEQLLEPYRDERPVQVAKWFSDGYYAVANGAADTLNFFDLRFGFLPAEGKSPIFGFQLYPRGPGQELGFQQKPFRQGEMDVSKLMDEFWHRIKGGQLAEPDHLDEILPQ